MTPADDERRVKRVPWGMVAMLGVGGALAIVILVMVAHRAESSTDFRDFWENGVCFRQTGRIATDLGVHNYLPCFTILMTPWSWLPLPVAAVLFVLVSLGLFGVTVWLCARPLCATVEARARWAVPIAVGLMTPYVYACAVLGNLGLVLLFLVVLAWYWAARGRPWVAGAALGLATLLKVLPAVLIVFFLLKRQWRVAGGAVGTIVVVGLGLPLVLLGPGRTVAAHRAFYEEAVRHHAARETILSEHPIKAKYNNNALPIVLRRLLSPVNGGTAEEPLRVNVAAWSGPGILAVYLALLGALGAMSLGALWRGAPVTELEASGRQSVGADAQFGVWCCLMLLASPLVWTHYLPLVYWPLAVVVERVTAARKWCAAEWVGAAALVVWLGGAILLAWPAARAAGAQIGSVAVLWVAVMVLSVRKESRAVATDDVGAAADVRSA